jgi:hypothetical protein
VPCTPCNKENLTKQRCVKMMISTMMTIMKPAKCTAGRAPQYALRFLPTMWIATLLFSIAILETHAVQSFPTSVPTTTVTTTRRMISKKYSHNHISRGGSRPKSLLTNPQKQQTPALTRVSSSSSSSYSSPKGALVEWTTDRSLRSMVASMGCIVTWMLTKHIPSYTIVHSCCTTGLLSCLLFTTPYFHMKQPSYSVAAFCGALAGMSGNILAHQVVVAVGTKTAATAALAPLLYYSACVGLAFGIWDTQKIGLGKGGRLGTIAFGGNLLYTITTCLYQQLLLKKNSALKLLSLVPSKTINLYASMPILTTLALSTLLLQSSRANIITDNNSKSDKMTQQMIYKILLCSTIAIPMILNRNVVSLVEYMTTVISIFIASQLVHTNISKFGPILPTSLVGMCGAVLLTGTTGGWYGITSPKVFLGALMGLTTLPNFGVWNFLQSSVLSAFLFHLGLLDGFGGKLGSLAYVGVLFGT